MASQPFVGIDFGTCNSSVAWFNPKTGQAEPLRNAEGEDKTPSVVYFGPSGPPLVGKYAEDQLAHAEGRKCVLSAVKRELARPRVWLFGTRKVSPVDAAAEVLKKLKRDAEQGHFHSPVTRAVVTCPAAFDEAEKAKLCEAAKLAGFREVELLEEPVAAAVAYAQAGVEVGRSVLVYDLGGGTFDVALLVRDDGEDTHRLAMEPRGERLGGEDFDRAVYDYFDQQVQKKLNRPLCPDGIDLAFLRQCRRWKETLSDMEATHPFNWQVPGLGTLTNLRVSRANLERLIESRVDRTIALTRTVRDEAVVAGHAVNTVILIGGSSRMPLILQRLKDTLNIEPRKWEKQDIAVALGAACHAQSLWGAKPAVVEPPPVPIAPAPCKEARSFLESAQAAFDQAVRLIEGTEPRLERLEAALRYAQAACDLDPHWTDALDLKGRIVQERLEWARAEAAFTAEIRAVQATSVTGRVIFKGRYRAAGLGIKISLDHMVLGEGGGWKGCDFPFRTTPGEHLLEVVVTALRNTPFDQKSYPLIFREGGDYRITLQTDWNVRFVDTVEVQKMPGPG